jgi:hypothetical protein
MDWPEIERSQNDEYLWVVGHGGGYVVMPTVQAGMDELPCIPSVQIRARRAYDGSPVVASRVNLKFAAQPVNASEVNRVGAEPNRFDALPSGVKSCRAGPPDHLSNDG